MDTSTQLYASVARGNKTRGVLGFEQICTHVYGKTTHLKTHKNHEKRGPISVEVTVSQKHAWYAGGNVSYGYYVKVVQRKQYEDAYIVMASDGMWDGVENDDVADAISGLIMDDADITAQVIAQYLTDMAIDGGSTDNITVIVVPVKKLV